MSATKDKSGNPAGEPLGRPGGDDAALGDAAPDIVRTKIAVDLLDVATANSDDRVRDALAPLLGICPVDAVFVAVLDPSASAVASVIAATRDGSDCRPESLAGATLDAVPWLAGRLEHLRIGEVADTRLPPEGATADGRFLREAGIGSMAFIGLDPRGCPGRFLALANARPGTGWDVGDHLLLKLLGSNYVGGLERGVVERRLADEQERNELATASANDGMWDFEVSTNRTWFSPRWKHMLGYDDDEDFDDNLDWRRLVHPDDLSRVQTTMREHLNGATERFESVHRMRHRDGGWRWMLSRAKARPDEHGRLKRLVGVELDITDRKLYEEALHREKESAQITLQSIGDGVITTDAQCRVEYLNPVAEELTGWKLQDAGGRPVDDVFRGFHEETCEPLENPLAVAIRRKRSIKSIRPTLLIRRDGNELYIESTAAPIRDGRGRIAGGVLVFHDVSESRELNRRLSYHASHDILTGLVNRREFENRLEQAIKKVRTREGSYVLCHLDLDQFKMVNDSCGHTAGDALLGQLGALLKSKVRWRDTLARLGGEEFGFLLENSTLDEAMTISEEIRDAIQAFKFTWDDRTFRLGASLGVVPVTPETEDVPGLMSAADSACAAAKEAGRNRVYSFQENDIELMRRRREMQWAARITNALEEQRFELFRQVIRPLNEVETGYHYELLLRMRDETGKMVSPELFISAAERYGLMASIDRWVIRHAFKWLVNESDELERLALCSINLSGQSLGDDQFLPFVVDQIKRSSIDASKICFEITETAAIASYSQANRFINALREEGCRFALDDFGTGMSSFGYLKHFPVDFLKIDGSFVKEILHDPIDREMVRSINEIGHLTGKKTIAEFAENEEIIAMLRSIGVDYAQGYGVAEPRRVADAIAS